jgi:hypothetical protein
MTEYILFSTIYFILIVGFKDFSGYFDYFKRFMLTSLFMLVAAIPLFLFAFSRLGYTLEFSILFLFLILAIIMMIIIFKIFNKRYVLRMDARFLISKLFEIVLQQSFVLVVVLTINSLGFGPYSIIVFAAFFGILHMLTFLFMPKKRAFYYTLFSFLGSMIFYVLITFIKNGLLLSCAVHYLFYFGIAIETYFNKKSVFNGKALGPQLKSF